MILFIYQLFILLVSVKPDNSFLIGNYKNLADHSRSISNPSTDYKLYMDNVHWSKFTDILPSFTYQYFILTGKVVTDGTMNPYSHILQIYRRGDPRYKILHFGYDNTAGVLFVRQSVGVTYYCNIEFIQQITNMNMEFLISIKSTASNFYIYTYIRLSDGTILTNSCTMGSSGGDWSYVNVDITYSNYASKPFMSTVEYNFLGTIYRTYVVQESYIDSSFSQFVRDYILSLNMYTQEGLSFLNSYYPHYTQTYVCIPDESSNKAGCAISNKLPSFFRGYSVFSAGKYFTFSNFKVDTIYYSYDKYTPPLFLTISFWVNVASTTEIESIPIITWSFQNIQFIKIFCTTTGAGCLLQYEDYTNDVNTLESLTFDQYYFVTFYFNSYVDAIMNVVILKYDGTLTPYTFSSNLPTFRFEKGNLKVGDSTSTFSTSFKLSQIKVILSGSVLFEPTIVDTVNVIKNCEVVIFRRSEYECLACKLNYFLFQNTCITSCGAGYDSDTSLRICIRKCSYRCGGCDPTNSQICTSCSDASRNFPTNCRCTSKYDDLISPQCFCNHFFINATLLLFVENLKFF